jgi:hypothetical protein
MTRGRRGTHAYDLETLRRACPDEARLVAKDGVAVAQYEWVARADPTLRIGVDKHNAWYVEWAAHLLPMYQRCLEAETGALTHRLRIIYEGPDPLDSDVECVHLVATPDGFECSVARAGYDALVADTDRLLVVWKSLSRSVLVVRGDTVMAALSDRHATAHRDPPAFESTDGGSSAHLPDASRYWGARRTGAH